MNRIALGLCLLFNTSVFAADLQVIYEPGMGPEAKSFTSDKPIEPVGGYHKARIRNGHKELFANDYKPKDYKNYLKRGTVKYDPDKRNYSWMNVIIPDGTVVRSSNFTQLEPRTKAIFCDSCVFVDCNLQNNLIDPTWTVISGRTVQSDINTAIVDGRLEMVNYDGEETEFYHIAPHPSLVPMNHKSRGNGGVIVGEIR